MWHIGNIVRLQVERHPGSKDRVCYRGRPHTYIFKQVKMFLIINVMIVSAASPTPTNGIKPTVCSSTDQPHEAHFRRVHGYHPSGTPLTVINSSILLRCASECLRHTDCDVIILSGSWSCSLHAFSVWNTSEALTYTHKAYKKICSG